MQITENFTQNTNGDSSLSVSLDATNSEKTAKNPVNTDSDGTFKADLSVAEDFSTKSGENVQNTEPCGQNSAFSELISRDFEEFSRNYPNISSESLYNNKNFAIFASGKENQPLSRLFSDFCTIVASLEADALAKARHQLTLEQSCVGALSSALNASEPYFTKEQVLKMSRDEISRSFEAIRRSQAHW